MNTLLEILKYTIPALVVVFLAYIMLRAFIKYNEKHLDFLKSEHDLLKQKLNETSRQAQNKTLLQAKLQAYERMTLFLERINPSNLIPRVLEQGGTVSSLQKQLLNIIREEYEHNLSQQVYISELAWELIKTAKENVIQLINAESARLKTNDNAANLAQNILMKAYEKENDSIQQALSVLKKDITQMQH